MAILRDQPHRPLTTMNKDDIETSLLNFNHEWITLEELEKMYKKWQEMPQNEENLNILTKNIHFIGDLAREMKNREYIGKTYMNFLFFLIRNTVNIPSSCIVQCLRVIGNCCIDHAENRQRILDLSGEDVFIEFLDHIDPNVSTVSLTSLLNLCIDSEAATERLEGKDVVSKILKSSNLNTNFDILARIIRWLMSRGFFKNLYYSKRISDILKETKKYDVDSFMHFLSIIQSYTNNVVDIFSIILMFLPQSDVQLRLVQSGKIYELLKYFYCVVPCQENFNSENKGIISMLINLFGEIAANNDYVEFILNNKLVMDMLLDCLDINSYGTLTMCACVMLGNLARTGNSIYRVCVYFVHELRLHEKLINIIKSLDNPKIIYSAAGFLKNLSISNNNKSIIGEAGGIKSCMKLFTFDLVKPIQYLAVSIFRQLIINETKNISFSISSGAFEQLLELRKKTDDYSIVMEASRVLSSMIRTINKFKLFDIEKKLASYTNLEDIFRDMILQTQYPIVRTDAIFSLALITRSFDPDLKKNAFNLVKDETILNILVELGQTGAKDVRDNIRFLLYSINNEFQNESIKSALLSLNQDTN
ncbi:hypothetical protein PCK1_001091 [Pneumocystis canis]|nr:hypothetical protein PCK1_001091 [Pneumocystis canis]